MTNARAKVEEIALYLGKPWKFDSRGEPSNWRFDLIDGMGRGLYFWVNGEKFKISGSFPSNTTNAHSSDHKNIGVSMARPAKDIAGDIMRRLMPHYLEAFEIASRRHEQNKERETHLDHIAQMIKRVSDGRINHYRGRGARDIYFEDGTAEISMSDKVELTLNNLTPAQAVRVISLIKSESTD